MRTTHLKTYLVAGVMVMSSLTAVSALATSASATSFNSICDPSLLAKASGPVNITFEESMPGGALPGFKGNRDFLSSLIATYNASQNKVHVTDVNDSGGYTDTWTKYTADLSTGTFPSVVMFDQYDTQAAADTQSILPTSTCLAADKSFSTKAFIPKALAAYTIGKTQYGMPFSVSTPVMYYNKFAFVAAGIKAPPTTMAQLIADEALLQKAHWSYGGKTGTYTYGVAIKKDPWLTMTWLGMNDMPFVNNGNGHTSRTTSVSFNNSMAQAYWTKIQQMVKNGALATGTTGTITQAYANLFALANNDAGITFDTTAALGSIQAGLPLYKNVSLGVAPLPTLTGKVTGAAPPGGNGLFIPKGVDATHAAAAWDFIKFLSSATSDAKWTASTGYIPIRTDAVTSWKAQQSKTAYAWYDVAYEGLVKGKADPATAGPMLGDYQDVSTALVTALDGLTQSPWPSPTSQLNSAATAANAAIASYNSRV